jgi:SNF2 family DNA or RNA helicase
MPGPVFVAESRTTLQAEDRCHRPGQTREAHVHYLLSSHTVDEQMFNLIDQKWATQRAVQDREAQLSLARPVSR